MESVQARLGAGNARHIEVPYSAHHGSLLLWRPPWLLRRHGGNNQRVFKLRHAGGLWSRKTRWRASAPGVDSYNMRSSRDVRVHNGLITVFFDAASGRQLAAWLPTGAASGDTIRSWISALHMASMWGWPFKLFICAMGAMVAGLSLSGVLVWRRKRRGKAKPRPKMAAIH